METVVIPDLKFLDRQFSYLKVFLGGSRALHHQIQKRNDANTNFKIAAIEITRKLSEVNKKQNEVHPHILHCTNILTDTIFSFHSEFLTRNPDVSVVKSDKTDVKEYMKTTKPMLDKEERNDLNKLVKNLKGMIELHKDYVYTMEKEANKFYTLKEKIQLREEVIRQRFSDTFAQESEIEYTLLTDFNLNLYKQAFRMMGFEALKSHAKTAEKKIHLEHEMMQMQKKIISSIEIPMKERLAKAMTELVMTQKLKYISQNRINEIQEDMMDIANRINEVLSDIIETNSIQYKYKPSSKETTRCDFMKNVRNMNGFLMNRSVDELNIDIPLCETKKYGLLTTDLGEYFEKTESYRSPGTIKVDPQNSPVLKGKVRQVLGKDNIIFGWTKSSMLSYKKKYGFYILNDTEPN